MRIRNSQFDSIPLPSLTRSPCTRSLTQPRATADAASWTPTCSRELAVVGNATDDGAGSDPITSLICGPREASTIVAACSRDGVSILSETILSHCVALCGAANDRGISASSASKTSSTTGDDDGGSGAHFVVSAVQIDAETIVVERMAVLSGGEDDASPRDRRAHPSPPFRMRCGLRIHGVAFDGASRRILVWSGRVAEVYYVDDGSCKSISVRVVLLTIATLCFQHFFSRLFVCLF